jgi:hypothetical protein
LALTEKSNCDIAITIVTIKKLAINDYFVASTIEVKLTNFGGDLDICMIMVGSYF